MKAVLEFTLPKDDSEFECASKGTELACFQYEVFSKLRELLKYGYDGKSLGKEADEIIEHLRDELSDEEVHLDHFN